MTKEHQGEVVALFCSVGKHRDMLFQVIDNLYGRSILVLFHIVQDALLTKQLPTAIGGHIHGFRQTVGIKQHRGVLGERHLLLLVVEMILNAYGKIGVHLQQMTAAIGQLDDWCVMGSIAIGEVVGFEVEHTYKRSDERQGVVGGCNGMIHLAHDIGRTLIVACQVAEQRSCNGHVKRGRNALSCYITDNKEELIPLDDEVVQVAPHLFGRCHGSEEIEVVSFWEDGGNHAHLNIVGNSEFALEAHLTVGSGFQLLDILLE